MDPALTACSICPAFRWNIIKAMRLCIGHCPFRNADRAGWTKHFMPNFEKLVLHTAAREGLFCLTCCLLPDYLHLIWMGLRLDSDQRNGMAFFRTHLEPKLAPSKFQHQAHDHVLKEEERRRNVFARVCNYILENPLRSKLVESPVAWKFSGAIIPGYPTLHPLQNDFWDKFWKLYAQGQQPDAGKIVRPPIRWQPT